MADNVTSSAGLSVGVRVYTHMCVHVHVRGFPRTLSLWSGLSHPEHCE